MPTLSRSNHKALALDTGVTSTVFSGQQTSTDLHRIARTMVLLTPLMKLPNFCIHEPLLVHRFTCTICPKLHKPHRLQANLMLNFLTAKQSSSTSN